MSSLGLRSITFGFSRFVFASRPSLSLPPSLNNSTWFNSLLCSPIRSIRPGLTILRIIK